MRPSSTSTTSAPGGGLNDPDFFYNTKVASDATSNQAATMTALKSAAHDYSTGLTVGTAVAQNTSLTFKITYSVKDDNNAQNTQSTANFTWEARNN